MKPNEPKKRRESTPAATKTRLEKVLSQKAVQMGTELGLTADFIVQTTGE